MGKAGSERVLDVPAEALGDSNQLNGWVLEGDDPTATMQFSPVDDEARPVVEAGPALAHDEVPFQGPDPRAVLAERSSGFDWRELSDRIGRWPILALLGLALLSAIFAAFISGNSRSLGDAASGDESQSSLLSAAAGGDESEPANGQADGDGRSTGAAGEFGPIEYYSGQLTEPADDLSSDITWVTTTTAPSTTTTEAGASTTTQPESTTIVPPDGLSVVAISPGRSSSQDPEILTGESITLVAEAQGGRRLRYRFEILRWSERSEEWVVDAQTRWRRSGEARFDSEPYRYETVRWIVTVVDDERNLVQSDPLHFRVVDNDNDDDNDNAPDNGGDGEDAAPAFANGGFDDVAIGGGFGIVSDAEVPGWSSSVGVIEVWANGFDGNVQAVSGTQFIELNSIGASSIAQVVEVSSGSDLRWSLAHRARSSDREAIEVQIRADNGDGEAYGPFTSSVGGWTRHSGDYEVPDGVSRLEFRIVALTRGSVGNFIDDIRIELDD